MRLKVSGEKAQIFVFRFTGCHQKDLKLSRVIISFFMFPDVMSLKVFLCPKAT